MSASRTVKIAWLVTAQRPFWTALFVMAGVGGMALAGQMVLSAPIMPSWSGLLVVVGGLLPDLIGMLGPVAVLIGSLAASQTWREGGECRALLATGLGMSPVLKAALLWGSLVGVGVAACTHVFGPIGRTASRDAVRAALWDSPVTPGMQLDLGGVFVGARADDASGAGVVVAARDWVAWADEGVIEDGAVRLTSGRAKALDDAWRISFEEARWPLPQRQFRPHNFDRTTPELRRHITAQRAAGRTTGRAELTLMKRSTLAVSTPLFALMGVCLAFTQRRPMLWAVGLIVGVWVLQRLADHGVGVVDPTMLAGAPLLVLCLAVVLTVSRIGRPG